MIPAGSVKGRLGKRSFFVSRLFSVFSGKNILHLSAKVRKASYKDSFRKRSCQEKAQKMNFLITLNRSEEKRALQSWVQQIRQGKLKAPNRSAHQQIEAHYQAQDGLFAIVTTVFLKGVGPDKLPFESCQPLLR